MPDHSAPPPDLLPEVRYLFTVRDHLVAWRVSRVELNEALSEPYDIRVELLSDDPELDPETLLGGAERGSSQRRDVSTKRSVESRI